MWPFLIFVDSEDAIFYTQNPVLSSEVRKKYDRKALLIHGSLRLAARDDWIRKVSRWDASRISSGDAHLEAPWRENERRRKCARKFCLKRGMQLYQANRTGLKILFKSNVNYERSRRVDDGLSGASLEWQPHHMIPCGKT